MMGSLTLCGVQKPRNPTPKGTTTGDPDFTRNKLEFYRILLTFFENFMIFNYEKEKEYELYKR
jgi:hypothetical protein